LKGGAPSNSGEGTIQMVEKDMILRNGSLEEPFFSICIPQFDRVNYLAEMLN